AGDSSVVKIYYDGAEIKSEFTRNRLRGKVNSFSDSVVGLRLADLGATPEILTPLPVETENVASEQKMSGFLLSMFLPYMIIILTMVGATYPAIDLTAGEKERGTLETILASPASRTDIAIGKFLTVFTTSLVTAMLAVTSLTLTAAGGLGAMANFSSEVSFQVEPLTFLVLLMLMIPVACLFSSVLLTLSLFAKSYKEAQSYITPLMFVIILPAMVTFTPGIELNTKLALIPVVNVSLVAKEALLGTFNWGYIGIVFFSTAVLAAVALFIAKRQFDREEVLFRI
ncbi:MAG: ABC transporter permease subunit, partial [candidate division Zixibacteria bacterium]|nr:ABC transporter permease subunit [candidate division Zixibacteria bacterium]